MAKTKTPKKIEAYHHWSATTTGQFIDHQPGNYYVSIKDGQKFGLLAGPFKKHAEALAMVDKAKAMALELNPAQAVWAAYGTVRMKDGYTKPGVLNEKLGI